MSDYPLRESPLFQETPFQELMSLRIREILLVCSDYDRFMLEEDGRIDEQLFQEYVSLSLRYPPKITQASTAKEAMEQMAVRGYDLVIVMLSVGEATALELAQDMKRQYPDKPVILLTPISTRETMRILKMTDISPVDLLFSWQGNTNIMLAMVKLLEDRMNVDRDVNTLGVQSIILVEDSVRYYSSYLPVIYETLIRQARNAMTEGLNEFQQTLRMRGRPKILLARTYEEAITLYEKYKENLLGVISDVAYQKEGKINDKAGLLLSAHIRSENQDLPILLQSSNLKHKKEALASGSSFLHKQTKTLLKELEHYIKTNYGFGDFVFRDPGTNKPVGYARDLKTLQRTLTTIDDNIFAYHVRKNDFSRWLRARALFTLAKHIRALSEEDFETLKEAREHIIHMIQEFRTQRGRGVIAEFDRLKFDELSFFSRIGSGSLGGKGRGLAFIDQELKKHDVTHRFPGVTISIPRTIVLTTQVFDDFMELNDLYDTALNETDDQRILRSFYNSVMPDKYLSDLDTIIEEIIEPIAVRSSSLLEDSHHQPFAGIYATYMLPNNALDPLKRREELIHAIKAVYASTYYQHSKAYMKSTNNIVEDEKMAVIIQEIAGKSYGDRFYPNISGVARSLNFYPIGPEKAEDGIVEAAFGLGKTVVDGGTSLRFSPVYPKKIIQLTDPQAALKTTQKTFYALNLRAKEFAPQVEGEGNLLYLDVREAEGDGSLRLVASTYDFENNRLRDGISRKGRRVITLAGVLKYQAFPLAEITKALLKMGQEAMNVPIEIEFAVNLDTPSGAPAEFSFLQIRPIVENTEYNDTIIEDVLPENALIYSEKALGNGIYQGIQDIVYVKPEVFDRGQTKVIGEMIREINREYSEREGGYVLVVLGRLGSTDPWLGIPLTWPDISHARIITESGTRDFRVEPSQGTHFFQNITSLGCGYLTINPDIGDGLFAVEALNAREAAFENQFLRAVRFPRPLTVKIEGKTGRALIYGG